jgi:radical SAM superfamily enzyme
MTEQEIKFIQDNIINFETAKLGYTKTIDQSILVQYEAIYKKYLDAHFVLTYWCGACVYDMVKRLLEYYETTMSQTQVINSVPEVHAEPVIEKPKRKRKAK